MIFETLNSIQPLSLYNNWSPRSNPPGKIINLDPKLAFSSDSITNPSLALFDEQGEWTSLKNNDNECSYWGISFHEPTEISEIYITFKNNSNPDYLVLETEENNEFIQVCCIKIESQQTKHIIFETIKTSKIRLVFYGYQRNKCHSIESLKILSPIAQILYIDSNDILKDLRKWLVKCCKSKNNKLSDYAVKTLYV